MIDFLDLGVVLDLVGGGDTRAGVSSLYGIRSTGTVGSWLGREVWQGACRAAYIVADQKIIAKIWAWIVFDQVLLRDTAPLSETVASVACLGLDIMTGTPGEYIGYGGERHRENVDSKE